MQKNNKNILITNLYSWKNKGDAAIILCMLEDIRNQFPKANITLSCWDENDINNKVYGNFQYQQHAASIYLKNKKRKVLASSLLLIQLFLFELFKKIRIDISFIFSKLIQDKIKSYQEYDLVIACGGGYLITKDNLNIITVLLFSYDFYLGSLFNKNIILYNQSVGPFYNNLHSLIFKRILSSVKLILCREKLTFIRLQKKGYKNIIQVADVAFNLKPEKTDTLRAYSYSESNIKVGITVRKWLNPDKQGQFEQEIATFISKTIQTENKINFYFIPQVIYSNNQDDDLVIVKNILKRIPEEYHKKIHMIEEDLHPSKLEYIISKMNYFIGTRMHSNIFALNMNIKIVAIAYEPKTIGIMDLIGLSYYVIKMEDLNSDTLYNKFQKLKSDTSFYNIIKKQLPRIQKISTNNIKDIISSS